MNILESSIAYERWLSQELKGNVDKKALKTRHATMAADAFQFLRATYWRWAEIIYEVCPELRDAPCVLGVGDIHVENFGSWRDLEGRLVWGVNDFDEAAHMPYVLDLVRLATSAVLAPVRNIDARKVCLAILSGYRAGIAEPAPFVLDRENRWLRMKVVVPEKERRQFWKKLDAKNGKRKRDSKVKKGNPPRRYLKVLRSSFPDSEIKLNFWPRVAGTGSLGRPRWIAYGTWKGAPIVREAKALVQSAWARTHNGSRRLQSADIASGKYRSPDPWYAVRKGLVVRRRSPNDRKIALSSKESDVPKAGFHSMADIVNAQMLSAMGRDLGAVHLGTGNPRKAIRADLEARGQNWLLEAVKSAAQHTRVEQREWQRVHRKNSKSCDR